MPYNKLTFKKEIVFTSPFKLILLCYKN